MRILYFQNLQIRQAKFLDSNVMEFSKIGPVKRVYKWLKHKKYST